MFNIIDLFKIKNNKYNIGVIRGYKFLKKKNSQKLIFNIKKELTNLNLNIKNQEYDKYLFLKNSSVKTEIIIRQYILHRFLNSYFNRSILNYYGKSKFKKFDDGYPFTWLKFLSKKNIKINYIKAFFSWKLKIIISLLDSLRKYFEIILNTLKDKKQKYSNDTDLIFVSELTDNLINSSLSGYTFINWLKDYIINLKSKKFVLLIQSKNILPSQKFLKKKILISKPFISLQKNKFIWNITFWYFKALCYCIFDLVLKDGFRAYILVESLKAKVYDLNFKNNNFSYSFHSCSDWIYRPLWTYISETRGSKIIFYFYSTNIFQLSINQKDNIYNIINYGWESNTWPNYFVWNKYQKDFISKLSLKAKSKIVGPILLQDEKNEDFSFNFFKDKKTVSLFDISIFRDFLYKSEGHLTNYETPDVAIKFIKDILEICIDLDIHIIYKTKRNYSQNLHRKYKKFIENIKNSNFHYVQPDISARYIIRNSDGCISFPFTSTSILAEFENIKNCFYDPTGKLIDNIIQTNNIKLIGNKKDLFKWINSL